MRDRRLLLWDRLHPLHADSGLVLAVMSTEYDEKQRARVISFKAKTGDSRRADYAWTGGLLND
jgi:hypothetical protein